MLSNVTHVTQMTHKSIEINISIISHKKICATLKVVSIICLFTGYLKQQQRINQESQTIETDYKWIHGWIIQKWTRCQFHQWYRWLDVRIREIWEVVGLPNLGAHNCPLGKLKFGYDHPILVEASLCAIINLRTILIRAIESGTMLSHLV